MLICDLPTYNKNVLAKEAVANCLTESARMLSQNRRLHLLIAEAELSLTALFSLLLSLWVQKIRHFRFTIVKVCFLDR
ncbi:MAG: hypothetical protein EWV41_00310 [Microcystis wesenbergii Mw_MB_S_20031200_S109]|uniref:Uncharacterized protein n=1 Tax=Microcystis wesenbergii Mw_MB_S_20031200_S109D TaxID=2486241 RepID=A0A552M8U5_9CHRO|nr:MAG: hypothetical protein EWV41_00310 [Microcystis wesenbergii Mw_MB_S_20031200_S109]TRV28881.1 MAG: hypothetical protein EWV88_02230 [Microcystis wesenbergii Mw_MB_S_20031200_S109D]